MRVPIAGVRGVGAAIDSLLARACHPLRTRQELAVAAKKVEWAFRALVDGARAVTARRTTPSRGISPKQRFAVLQRDNFTCVYCGLGPPVVELTVDHRVPVAKGGTSHPDNLCAACEACNAGKGKRSLSP